MSRAISILAAIIVFAAAASTAQADITVTKVGNDLYVDGTDSGDSVLIDQDHYQVRVYDYVAAKWYGPYFYLDNVWVDTGEGADYVEVDDYYTLYPYYGADVYVDTGNGQDDVYVGAYRSGVLIDVSTGNGEDYVHAQTRYAYDWYYQTYGEIRIDTGNAEDDVVIQALGENTVTVSTGNGDDYVRFTGANNGYYYHGGIAIDTGKGDDEIDFNSDYWYFYGGIHSQVAYNDFDIDLGQGDDTVYSSGSYYYYGLYYCSGTIDGNKGDDSKSGLPVTGGSVSFTNFED